MSFGQTWARAKCERRFLTDDETITLYGKFGEVRQFRLRIWRGSEATPVVLASPHVNEKGFASVPSRMSTKIANLALAMAGYPDSNILYFEHDPPMKGHESTPSQVHFEFFGHRSRLRLYRPIYRYLAWCEIESIVGEPIER